MKETKLEIGGMSCGGCVAAVESGLKGVEGVQEAEVDLENNCAVVKHNDVPTEKLIEAVEDRGFQASESN